MTQKLTVSFLRGAFFPYRINQHPKTQSEQDLNSARITCANVFIIKYNNIFHPGFAANSCKSQSNDIQYFLSQSYSILPNIILGTAP